MLSSDLIKSTKTKSPSLYSDKKYRVCISTRAGQSMKRRPCDCLLADLVAEFCFWRTELGRFDRLHSNLFLDCFAVPANNGTTQTRFLKFKTSPRSVLVPTYENMLGNKKTTPTYHRKSCKESSNTAKLVGKIKDTIQPSQRLVAPARNAMSTSQHGPNRQPA